MSYVKFAGYRIRVPHHPVLRTLLGATMVMGGFLGFLPILGFWMLPFGLFILSIDYAVVRKFRRKFSVWLGLWLMRRWPQLAKTIGYGALRAGKI